MQTDTQGFGKKPSVERHSSGNSDLNSGPSLLT